MVLLLDVGNSRLKICLYQPVNDVELPSGLAHTAANLTSPIQNVVAIDLKHIEDQHNLLNSVHALQSSASQAITQIWGVSVAGTHINQLIEDQLIGFGLTVQWLKPTRTLQGLYNHYVNPDQLGADRWAAALGLHARFKTSRTPIILANFGTATTIDTVSTEPSFLGGLILPGVDLMFESLARRTAQLPMAQGSAVDHPTNTDCAIVSGVIAAQLGALQHQYNVVQQQFKSAPIVCVSGGAWPKVEPAWSLHFGHTRWQVLPHIVLEGLAAVAHSTALSTTLMPPPSSSHLNSP
jgi:type III pantothenate kinase